MVASVWDTSGNGGALGATPRTVVMSKPGGATAGDVVYLFVATTFQSGTPGVSCTGFTSIAGPVRFASSISCQGNILRRVLNGGEGATFTVDITGAFLQVAPLVILVMVRGADATTPEDATTTSSTTTSGASNTAPTITTVSPNALMLCHWAWRNTNPYTTIPGTMSNVLSHTVSPTSARVASELRASAGATGTRLATTSGGGTDDGFAFTVAVRSLVITTASPAAVGHAHVVATAVVTTSAQATPSAAAHAHAIPTPAPFNGVYALPSALPHAHAIPTPAPRASSSASPTAVAHTHEVETPYPASVIQVPGDPVEPDASGPADRFPQGPYDPTRPPHAGADGTQYRPGGVDYT